MKIDSYISDDAVLSELAARLRRARLANNLSQQELATEAGIAPRSLQRFERGEAAPNLPSLIRLLRALGLLDGLDALIPENPVNPFAETARPGTVRRRASRAASSPPSGAAPGRWIWGDERDEPA